MIKRRFVRTRQAQPGMKIDQSIVDRMGRILVARGSILDEYVIDSLLKLGVMNIYIQEGEADPEEVPMCAKAQENIEKLRTADRRKVSLSNSVRERVATGIQFIYSSNDSDNLENVTNSITTDLLDAIEGNDAIAIDINELKTSDEYTFKHSVDVATMAMVLAKKQGLSKKEIYEIGVAGILHDVGKTKIPNEILNKPGRLDDDEFAIMKQHSVYGYRMLQNRPHFSNEIMMAVLQHHEKINGKGYPLGANAEQITPYAKILTVADIYDALVTERPYKQAFSQHDAVEMIMSMTNELDMKAINSFMESMILYPVDSIVSLSNGEKAKVVKNNPNYILRPTVVGLETGNVYNLGEDFACANVIIL